MSFGLDALRRLRERQQQPTRVLVDVSPDAPYDEPEETVHVWNGERWVPWKKWLATTPAERADKPREPVRAFPFDATRIAVDCGGTRIWLVKDGERWLMFVGTQKPRGRRRDFASPFLAHAVATAERWYGASGGWRAEKNSNGSRAEAADLYTQVADEEERTGKRGNDELALDGR